MKKKGFTLIELLAVIIILAIIALIAVPQIIKIVNKARRSAAEDTVYGIVKSVDNYVANFMLQNNGSFPKKVLEFTCNSDGCSLNENTINNLNNYDITNLESLDFKGKKPTSGTIRVSDNGKIVTTTNLEINGFTCGYMYEKAGCFKESDVHYYHAANVMYLDPTDLTKECDENNSNSGTETKDGCMKWYVYSENDILGTKNLILDHNTTAMLPDYNINDSCYLKVQMQVLVDTEGWQADLNSRLIEADEIANIAELENFNKNNKLKIILSGEKSCTESVCEFNYLYDRIARQCVRMYGCPNNSDKTVWCYGTSTSIDGKNIWEVCWDNSLQVFYGGNCTMGIRPVITIQK